MPPPAPVPIARTVRFNPRMKTRTAYGSYQSDASVDLLSASPAASFLAWRYGGVGGGGRKRSGSVLSAKRAPAVAQWKAYYGALDSSPAAPSYPAAGQPSPTTTRAAPAARAVPPTARSFGLTVWDRVGSLDYWLWKTGLDDWTDGGCCSLPQWDEQEDWAADTGGGGASGVGGDRRRAGWSGGVGEGRPGGIF